MILADEPRLELPEPVIDGDDRQELRRHAGLEGALVELVVVEGGEALRQPPHGLDEALDTDDDADRVAVAGAAQEAEAALRLFVDLFQRRPRATSSVTVWLQQ